LFNAPYSSSANVRIVLPDDPPLTHDDGTADLWVMTAGTATAETDGQMDGKTLRNGSAEPCIRATSCMFHRASRTTSLM